MSVSVVSTACSASFVPSSRRWSLSRSVSRVRSARTWATPTRASGSSGSSFSTLRLIAVHGSAVEQDPQFAVGELGGKIVRPFFQRRGVVGVGGHNLVGIELGLSLGLGWPLSLLRGCGGRGTCRRGRRLGLRRYQCSQRQDHD